jgi:hypothetical protein
VRAGTISPEPPSLRYSMGRSCAMKVEGEVAIVMPLFDAGLPRHRYPPTPRSL